MAYNCYPARKFEGVYGDFLVKCGHAFAERYIIEVGWGGKSCIIEMPDKETAKLCMKNFIIPYEDGIFEKV